MDEQKKPSTIEEALSIIYEHNLKVEQELQSIKIITISNQDQLKILANDSKEFSKELVRIDVFQKFHKQEFDEYRRMQEQEKNKLFDDVRGESAKIVDNRFMIMENKFQKKIIYIMFVVTIAALLAVIKEGYPIFEKILKLIFGGL